jgi:hypothetical protein
MQWKPARMQGDLLSTGKHARSQVTMDMIKVFYAQLVRWDVRLVNPADGEPAAVANSAIVEDLGCVPSQHTDLCVGMSHGSTTITIEAFTPCIVLSYHDMSVKDRTRALTWSPLSLTVSL